MSVTITEERIAGPHGPLRVRTYLPDTPAGPGLVWAHGGGFVAGDLDMPEGHGVARDLAAHGVTVISVDYRRSPVPEGWDHELRHEEDGRYPVAHDEVVAAFTWAAASGRATGPWSLGGASAGANLATGAALRLLHTGGPVPAHLVLAYPTLHAVQTPASPELRALLDARPADDVFTAELILEMYENYVGGPVGDADVYAIPGTASADELSGLPPVLMINDEVDGLRPSGEEFARALASAGVAVEVSVEPDQAHGHLNRPGPAATATIDRIAATLLPASHPTTKESA